MSEELNKLAEYSVEDRLDSGMQSDEPGTPYTMSEAEEFADGRTGLSDAYAQELVRFLIRRIQRLSPTSDQTKE